MSFIIVVLCLALLIVLISYFKVDAFIAFLISSILAGIALGIPLEKLPDSVNNGIIGKTKSTVFQNKKYKKNHGVLNTIYIIHKTTRSPFQNEAFQF